MERVRDASFTLIGCAWLWWAMSVWCLRCAVFASLKSARTHRLQFLVTNTLFFFFYFICLRSRWNCHSYRHPHPHPTSYIWGWSQRSDLGIPSRYKLIYASMSGTVSVCRTIYRVNGYEKRSIYSSSNSSHISYLISSPIHRHTRTYWFCILQQLAALIRKLMNTSG